MRTPVRARRSIRLGERIPCDILRKHSPFGATLSVGAMAIRTRQNRPRQGLSARHDRSERRSGGTYTALEDLLSALFFGSQPALSDQRDGKENRTCMAHRLALVVEGAFDDRLQRIGRGGWREHFFPESSLVIADDKDG